MKKVFLILLLALSVLLVACAPDGPGAFREEARNQMTDIRRDIMDIRDINVRVSQIPVMRLLDCDRTLRVAERQISFTYPDGFVQTQFWRAFDLVEDDALDFTTAVNTLNFPDVFVFYDYQLRSIDLSSENCARTNVDSFSPEELFVYGHEFVNAMQSVELDLRALLAVAAPTLDHRLAANALAEGDATLTSQLYLEQVNDDTLSAFTAANLLQARFTDETPAIIQAELLFPYVQGQNFAQALYAAGQETVEQPEAGEAPLDPADFQTAWDLLNQAYQSRNQPQSTEHILHPDRYLAGDAPLDVDLVEVSEAIGAVEAGSIPTGGATVDTGGLSGSLGGGDTGAATDAEEAPAEEAPAEEDANIEDSELEVIDEELSAAVADEVFTEDERDIFTDDVWVEMRSEALGEFYLRQHLASQLDEATVETAATGWGGDEYAFFYNGVQDEHAWILRIAWDTPEDMDEFIAAYSTLATSRQGTEGSPQPNGATCWQADDSALCTFTETALLSPPPQPTRGQAREANTSEMVISFAPTLADALAMIDVQLAGPETE